MPNPIVVSVASDAAWGYINKNGAVYTRDIIVNPFARRIADLPANADRAAGDFLVAVDLRPLLSAVLRVNVATVPDVAAPASLEILDNTVSGLTFAAGADADVWTAISGGTTIGSITSATPLGTLDVTISAAGALTIIRAHLAAGGTVLVALYATALHATSKTELTRAAGMTLTLTFLDQATDPVPADGATAVPVNQVLSGTAPVIP